MGIFDLDFGGIISGVGQIIDDIHTSDEERQKILLEGMQIEADLRKGQMDINETEAKHKSIFVAGWRPFIGWVGGAALAYQFILYPLLIWIWSFAQGQGWISVDLSAPPILNTGALLTVITGMLGIGGMRSYDKLKGTDTKSIK